MFDEKRYLAIDYGTKRIGLALSDPLFTFAYSFKTILNDKNLWKELEKIITEKSVKEIILGMPVREDGQKAALENEILKFKEHIQNKFKIKVVLRDEQYTSVLAKRKIMESVKKKSKRKNKALIDSSSAAILLQEYLDNLG